MVITSGTVFDSKHALEGAVDEWFADSVAAEVKYGHIGSWNTSRVTDFNELFCAVSFCSHYNSGASSAFDIDVSPWDTAAVTDMSFMFRGAGAFDGDVGEWNTSAVTDTSYMFYGAYAFDQDIGEWDVSVVTDMRHMFREASLFNADVGDWDTPVAVSVHGCLRRFH